MKIKHRKNGLCHPLPPSLFWGLGVAAGLLFVVLTWWLVNRRSEE